MDDTRLELVTSRTSSGCATSCANRPFIGNGYCTRCRWICQHFFAFSPWLKLKKPYFRLPPRRRRAKDIQIENRLKCVRLLSVGDVNGAFDGLSVAGEDELRRADGDACDRTAAGLVGLDAYNALVRGRPFVVGRDGKREVRAGQRYLVADMDQELGALFVAVVDAEGGYLRRGGRRRRGSRRRRGGGGDVRRRGGHGGRVGIVRVLKADSYHDDERRDDGDYQNYAEYELPFAVVGGSAVGGGALDGAGGRARRTPAVLNSACAALRAAAAQTRELFAAAAAAYLRNKAHMCSSLILII